MAKPKNENTPAKGAVEPREVTIKHGVFWYHEPEMTVSNGEEKEILVERLAFRGQTISLTRAKDIERGDKHGAFFTDEELRERNPKLQLAAADTGEVDPASLDDEELVEWIQSSGEFDGRDKPTAEAVVSAGESDPVMAARLVDAERKANGDAARVDVIDPLSEVAAKATV
jgi:hypothetical protein